MGRQQESPSFGDQSVVGRYSGRMLLATATAGGSGVATARIATATATARIATALLLLVAATGDLHGGGCRPLHEPLQATRLEGGENIQHSIKEKSQK